MPTDIALPQQPVMGTQRVWTRAKWSDPWTPRLGLRCTQFRKCTIPQIGTATLHWIAGRVSLPGESSSYYRAPLDLEHHFVKIEYQPYEAGAAPILWFGTVEEVHEKRGDRVKNVDGSIVAGKKQVFTCHELTLLLARTPILDGWFDSSTGVATKIGLAPVFNEGGVGNREFRTTDGVYLFSEESPKSAATPDAFSSLDIVKYLLKHHQPKTGLGKPIFTINAITGGADGISLHFTSEPLVHTWDQPIFDPHAKNLLTLLGMIFDQRAGLGCYLSTEIESSIPNYPETTYLRVFTYAESDISLSLDGQKTIKANPTQWNIITDGHPGLTVDLKRTHSDQYTQVVCQGARRLSVGTFSNADDTWDKGWPEALETKYNAGASGAANYDTPNNVASKRDRNKKIRNGDDLVTVYSRFRIKDTWDGKVKGGNAGEAKPLLVDDNEGEKVFGNWPLDRNIQPMLPMREGEDYSNLSAVTQSWTEPVPYRLPMAFMEDNTNPGHWFQVDVNGMSGSNPVPGENRQWSCSVRAEPKAGLKQFAPSLSLKTGGHPQHVLASAEFTPLPADEKIVMYDWKKMLVTLAIEEARYCEARWPKQIALGVPAVRTKIIQCGGGFQKNYMAPNTVIGLDPTNGGLKRNASGGYIRDDEKKLEEIARAMHEFYSKPRISMAITKKGATAQLGLGHLIHQLGATSDPTDLIDIVNSVVTEITVIMPEGGGQPTQHWTTNRGELDHVPIKMAGG